MFSQFRSAVEHLAQQQQTTPGNRRPVNTSDPSQSSTQSSDVQSGSKIALDDNHRSPPMTTPGQLAESALQNFRKALISSRTSSAGPSQISGQDSGIRNRSLEERLRASLTLGDASEQMPDTIKIFAPKAVEPASIALPLSPEQELSISSLEDAFDPLGVQLSPNPSLSLRSPHPVSGKLLLQSPSEVVQASTGGPDVPQATSSSSSPKPAPPPRIVSPLSLSPHDIPNSTTLPETTNDIPPSDTTVGVPITNVQIPDISDSVLRSPRPLSPFLAEENGFDFEKLHKRLKLVEKRFNDVSISFKRLQAEKHAVDQVLKDLTPLQSMTDLDGLRDHLVGLEVQRGTSTEQITRLNEKVHQYDLRLEELRDVHRLESASQSELVERLRKQVAEAEALLRVGEEASNESKTELDQLRADVEKAKGLAKEEEEKRVKAISLLKTVRAKLVKAEKEKDDAVKEASEVVEKEKVEREREQLERSRLESDLEKIRSEKEREVTNLRTQFEKEMLGLKDRLERENAVWKGQSELEAITTKATYTKELAAKTSRITALEASVRALSQEKDAMFDQLQVGQAEFESSQSHLDSVEARSSELQYQLREAEDRIEILTDELAEVKGKLASDHHLGSSSEELARILSETEGKYESRISDLKNKMRALEKERHEAEDEWSKNLQERGRELERLRRLVEEKEREYAESIRSKTEMKDRLVELEADKRKLKTQTEAEKGVLLGLQHEIDRLKEAEISMKQERDGAYERLQAVEKQFEETKVRESALKLNNKTLREELRKVQSSAALLERQRNPGIGYWGTSRINSFTQSAVDLQSPGHPARYSTDDSSAAGSPTRMPASPTSVAPMTNEEDINLEYIRNVILQFLEHKDMRPNLVRVLSVILHFTPQETRRLIAKV